MQGRVVRLSVVLGLDLRICPVANEEADELLIANARGHVDGLHLPGWPVVTGGLCGALGSRRGVGVCLEEQAHDLENTFSPYRLGCRLLLARVIGHRRGQERGHGRVQGLASEAPVLVDERLGLVLVHLPVHAHLKGGCVEHSDLHPLGQVASQTLAAPEAGDGAGAVLIRAVSTVSRARYTCSAGARAAREAIYLRHWRGRRLPADTARSRSWHAGNVCSAQCRTTARATREIAVGSPLTKTCRAPAPI
mmetsp:Transcript_99138/g.289288  ORF Transcript_99138/g.289288 Transcript_99138/m.289288 type:complete len:250 (+) Transcript_99138:2148-2897(+)